MKKIVGVPITALSHQQLCGTPEDESLIFFVMMCKCTYEEDKSYGDISYIVEQCSFFLCSALYSREHLTWHIIKSHLHVDGRWYCYTYYDTVFIWDETYGLWMLWSVIPTSSVPLKGICAVRLCNGTASVWMYMNSSVTIQILFRAVNIIAYISYAPVF